MALIAGDQEFFPLLDQLAARLTSAATLLIELFEHPDQHDPLVGRIRDDENGADELTRSIINRLGTSFVPALDATEIYALANALDDVVDSLEDAAARVQMFRLAEVDAAARELGDIMRRCAAVLEAAVAKLDDPNRILEGISEAWRLEEEGNEAYASAVRALFDAGCDPLDLLKRKELYDVLETAINRSRDSAEVLTSIAVKRS